jgi:prepilin-type N-terminal cleavage/methylation domain-containing protein/prepilin-type processing-associated H-X9-DG protein
MKRFVKRPLAGVGRSAFTLIELLTVIAIIGILAAILIPVVGSVRDRARSAQGLSNLRQLGLAVNLYADDHGERLPPWADFPVATRENPNPTQPRWQWIIAPYTDTRQIVREEGRDYRGMGLLHICPNSQHPVTNPDESTYSVNINLFPARNPTTGAQTAQEYLISTVARPSQVIMIADGYQELSGGGANSTFWRSSSGYGGDLMAPVPLPNVNGTPQANGAHIEYRQGGSANAVFVDGHAESMRRGSISFLHVRPEI